MEFVTKEIGGYPFEVVDSWWSDGIPHGFGGGDIDLRKRPLLEEVHLPEIGKIELLDQVHGADVARANGSVIPKERKADAWFITSDNSSPTFGIETADCLPVIVRSKGNDFFAVVHCGWRSIVDGILSKVLAHFNENNIAPEQIEIAIGPGAQKCCYEISKELAEVFAELDPSALIRKNSIFKADLKKVIVTQALAYNVPLINIASINFCTICDKKYFSFRRHKDQAGRQVSFLKT